MALELLAAWCLFATLRGCSLAGSKERGCDAYFFLLCAESFRARKRLPIVLPELYLLEPTEQWYPPLFAMLLGILPHRLLVSHFRWLNHLLDSLVGLGVFLLARHLAPDTPAAWAALALYAIEANLLAEYQTLTARSLAAALFTALLCLGLAATTTGEPTLAALALLAGVLLFFTHKLAMQLLWFLLPWLTLLLAQPLWALLLVGIYALALLVGRRLTLNILRAHADIVAFWYRNWRLLSAHPVRQSPVYGEEQAAGFHGTKGRSATLHLKRLLMGSPWLPAVALAACLQTDLGPTGRSLIAAIVGIHLWAALTLFVPPLRCLGEGTKYLKFSAPLCVAVGVTATWTADEPALWLLALLAMAWQLFQWGLVVRDSRRADQSRGTLDPELAPVLARLREAQGARVLCLPSHLADTVAYHTRRQVLFGGHGYGFRRLEPFFPVLRKTVEQFVAEHGLTHMLLHAGLTDINELRCASSFRLLLASGGYWLYETLDKRSGSGQEGATERQEE